MRNILILNFLITILFLQFNQTRANFSNEIIAKVNNEIITKFDLENEIKTIMILNNLEMNRENVLKNKNIAMNSLIRKLIKKSEIKKFDIKDYDDKKLNGYIDNLTNERNISKKEFVNLFKQYGVNYSKFIDNIKIEFLWNSLIVKLYKKQIIINPVEIDNEIEKIINNQDKQIMYKLSQLEIPVTEDIAVIIEKIKMKIKNDKFEEAITEFSIAPSAADRGSLGWINKNNLSENIINSLEKINISETTEPIKTTNSVTFLRIDDIKTNKVDLDNLENIKNKIILEKQNEKLNLFSRSHFSKLETSSLIEKNEK